MPTLYDTAKKRLKRAYLAVKSATTVDLGGDINRTVFLAGGARSGTTWLSELINYDNRYRYMFEPFAMWQLGDFWYGSYFRPDDRDPRLVRQAEQVLSGRYRHPEVDLFSPRLVSDRRLIKEVRANLWLKWMHTQFPQVPAVFVMRHPIPTVRSRFIRYFDANDKNAVDSDPEKRTRDYLHYLLGQPALLDDYLKPFAADIAGAKSLFDQRIFTWCVQNYVPLKQLKPGDAFVTTYELLAMQPRTELPKLFAHIGRPIDERVFGRLWKPSPQARTKTLPEPWTIVSSWLERVTDAEKKRAIEILSIFGLDKIYSTDPMPDSSALDAYALVATNAPAKGLA
jgi:sulfotransferase family protein